MQQYFISSITKLGESVLLSLEQSHHILTVLRMKDYDVIRIVDGASNIFLAHIQKVNKQVNAIIYEQLEDHTKLPVQITLVSGMLKGEKWDFLLQKVSELGVHTIVPFSSKRSVVKTKEEKLDKKLTRWNKIALEACEQCKRSTLVQIEEPISFSQIVNFKSQLNIIAYEDADCRSESLGKIIKQNPHITSITFVVGCEGGFDKDEVAYLEKHDFQRVSLGTRILRAETAAMYVVNAVNFYYDMEMIDEKREIYL